MLFNRLREVRGTTPQQKVADDLGVTRQTISSIENGRYVPSLELAMALAGYFALYVEEMFSADGCYAQFPGRPPRLRHLDQRPGGPAGGPGGHDNDASADQAAAGPAAGPESAVPEQVPAPHPQEDL